MKNVAVCIRSYNVKKKMEIDKTIQIKGRGLTLRVRTRTNPVIYEVCIRVLITNETFIKSEFSSIFKLFR